MPNLQQEVLMYFNKKNWSEAVYASSDCTLVLKNNNLEISFYLSKNNKPTLSGKINKHQNGDNLNFVFFDNPKNIDFFHLLDHLFLFMKPIKNE